MPCYNIDTGACVGVGGWCQWICNEVWSVDSGEAVATDAQKLGLSTEQGMELAALPKKRRCTMQDFMYGAG